MTEPGCFTCRQEEDLASAAGWEKIAQFAEAKAFGHTHFHVIPRAADLPAERIGPGIFDYLARPESEHLSDDELRSLARRFRPVFEELLGTT